MRIWELCTQNSSTSTYYLVCVAWLLNEINILALPGLSTQLGTAWYITPEWTISRVRSVRSGSADTRHCLSVVASPSQTIQTLECKQNSDHRFGNGQWKWTKQDVNDGYNIGGIHLWGFRYFVSDIFIVCSLYSASASRWLILWWCDLRIRSSPSVPGTGAQSEKYRLLIIRTPSWKQNFKIFIPKWHKVKQRFSRDPVPLPTMAVSGRTGASLRRMLILKLRLRSEPELPRVQHPLLDRGHAGVGLNL